MTDISRHPLLKQAYDVCQAIEKCGASVQLTHAVMQASDLMRAVDAHLLAQPAPAKVEAIQGEAMSFMLDPLEQAIESTARIMRDEREDSVMMHTMVSDEPLSDLYRRMSTHLDALLAIQIERVTADE